MKSNQSGALSPTTTWQCGPPPNPASFRPVEVSPWPGWFGSAEAAEASPKDVSTTTVDTTNARFIVCSLPGTDPSHGYYVTHPRADSSARGATRPPPAAPAWPPNPLAVTAARRGPRPVATS